MERRVPFALTSLAVAPAAHAGNTECSIKNTTSKYFADCNRDTDDGDPGGVSGDVNVTPYNSSGVEADALFDAKREGFDVHNDLDRKMEFKLM
ncbi:hypothetical protein [Streptomyces chattanoogensis]|uniref:hypothetical protein n=1 Tax=Streptomyces chattanoogensis TaxID=66876 RepID=UPI00369B8A68